MGEGFQVFDILLFAAIAAFLVLRLRGVLGKRTGHEHRPQQDPFHQNREAESERDKVVHLPNRDRPLEEAVTDEDLKAAAEKAETPLSAGLTQIKLADRSFDEEGFLGGARGAFEMVVEAFAAGDRKQLQQLLSREVFENFETAIAEREQAGQSLETTLVSIKEAQIVEAELQDRTAYVTVRFVSEQVNLLRDAEGKKIEGDAETVTDVVDIWTFARNTRSSDPNWTLVATQSPED